MSGTSPSMGHPYHTPHRMVNRSVELGTENGGTQTTPPSTDNGTGWTLDEIQQLQKPDQSIRTLATWLQVQQRPSLEELGLVNPELKSYWSQWDSLTLMDGIVYRASNGRMGPTNTYSCWCPSLSNRYFWKRFMLKLKATLCNARPLTRFMVVMENRHTHTHTHTHTRLTSLCPGLPR